MKLYGLLGYKIGYSLSPAMHNAAFKKLKLSAEYKIFDVPPLKLNSFLNSLLRSNIYGLNVTVPYKQKVYDFLKKYGSADEISERLGAVNTIVVRDKSIFGYNTDAIGFMKSLSKDLKFSPRNKNIFIFGAGGAGSAIALTIARASNNIYMTDIDRNKIVKFQKRFYDYFGRKKLRIVGNDENNIKSAVSRSDLIINASGYGKKDKELILKKDDMHKNQKVFDLIYRPEITPMIKEARLKGLKAINGLGMLLYQGVASFEIWTGKRAPLAVMRGALEKAMR